MTNRIANLGVSNNPYQTKGSSATTGVESGTELNIDDIINKLKNGDTSVLELFKNFSVNYAMEFTDTGYVVKFTYQGIKYEITYINTESSTESSNEETDTEEPSVAQPPTTQPPVTNPQTKGVTPPTETDPHYPQGYTKEEIENYLRSNTISENFIEYLFGSISYWTTENSQHVSHKLYEMFFVEKDGMYYFRMQMLSVQIIVTQKIVQKLLQVFL